MRSRVVYYSRTGNTRLLAEAISIPVVASGGVSSIQDVKDLLPLQAIGVIGVIIGKALYSGALDLKDALDLSARSGVEADTNS